MFKKLLGLVGKKEKAPQNDGTRALVDLSTLKFGTTGADAPPADTKVPAPQVSAVVKPVVDNGGTVIPPQPVEPAPKEVAPKESAPKPEYETHQTLAEDALMKTDRAYSSVLSQINGEIGEGILLARLVENRDREPILLMQHGNGKFEPLEFSFAFWADLRGDKETGWTMLSPQRGERDAQFDDKDFGKLFLVKAKENSHTRAWGVGLVRLDALPLDTYKAAGDLKDSAVSQESESSAPVKSDAGTVVSPEETTKAAEPVATEATDKVEKKESGATTEAKPARAKALRRADFLRAAQLPPTPEATPEVEQKPDAAKPREEASPTKGAATTEATPEAEETKAVAAVEIKLKGRQPSLDVEAVVSENLRTILSDQEAYTDFMRYLNGLLDVSDPTRIGIGIIVKGEKDTTGIAVFDDTLNSNSQREVVVLSNPMLVLGTLNEKHGAPGFELTTNKEGVEIRPDVESLGRLLLIRVTNVKEQDRRVVAFAGVSLLEVEDVEHFAQQVTARDTEKKK